MSVSQRLRQNPAVVEQIVRNVSRSIDSVDAWKALAEVAGHHSVSYKLFLKIPANSKTDLLECVHECLAKISLTCEQLVEISCVFVDTKSPLTNSILSRTIEMLGKSPKKVLTIFLIVRFGNFACLFSKN